MIPNVAITYAFGKFVFVAVDMAIALLLLRILQLRGVAPGDAIKYIAVLLFHPLATNVTTRGSADGLICLMVLAVIYLLMVRRLWSAAVVYGFAVHFKIYPIIYALPLVLFLDSDYERFLDRRESPSSHLCAAVADAPTPPVAGDSDGLPDTFADSDKSDLTTMSPQPSPSRSHRSLTTPSSSSAQRSSSRSRATRGRHRRRGANETAETALTEHSAAEAKANTDVRQGAASAGSESTSWLQVFMGLFTWRRIGFALVSGGVFLLLKVILYKLYVVLRSPLLSAAHSPSYVLALFDLFSLYPLDCLRYSCCALSFSLCPRLPLSRARCGSICG